MPQYEWRCHVCEAANHATDNNCSQCGFPAKADGRDIAAAREARNPRSKSAYPRTPDALERLGIELRPLPLWRQAIAILGLVTAVCGGAYVKITFSWVEMLVGLIALFAGGAVFGMATYAGRDVNGTNPKATVIQKSPE
jgi:ribosomal protein L37E